jgi:hypothetical protein
LTCGRESTTADTLSLVPEVVSSAELAALLALIVGEQCGRTA